MSEPFTQVLIAFSKGFDSSALFMSKVPNLISNISQFDVSLLQDDMNVGKKYFEAINVSTNNVTFNKSQFKNNLKKFSHIIIFWDGENLSELIFYATLSKIPLKIIPVEITKVKNKDNDEPFDVYIGRGTRWGNPFPIGIGGVGDDREEVIKKYKEYFQKEILMNPDERKHLLSLRGYKLGCHCKPLACHGDIIAAYLNSDESNE